MPPKKQPPPVQQTAIGDGNVQVAGDNNTVNIIQKFFNIFKSDKETTDQRNRRIMLGHVENFWIKGILEKSLHGAALLDLGIKEDPDALNYPGAIKREASKETLPAGTSMLEIFQEIGMGRSLLILGAPGSGKTTMLLELTRQLIESAREDVTEPIPIVFNLSSWTEKLTLADWLARELNIIYTIPKKVAPTWVKENKMLLLLDGLDEGRQESRDKCVDAINQFRKENGLTSMAVCSRIQDYTELKSRLSFDGAIEIQPLTSNQVDEYFERSDGKLEGLRHVLEKDTVMREMAESPLFLSIMTLAYRGTEAVNILVSQSVDKQRKYLFDTYIERMFMRPERSRNALFKKQDVLHWLSWLARKMADHNQLSFLIELMQPSWLEQKSARKRYWLVSQLVFSLVIGLSFALGSVLSIGLVNGPIKELVFGLVVGLLGGLMVGFPLSERIYDDIETVDILILNVKELVKGLFLGQAAWLVAWLVGQLITGWIIESSEAGAVLRPLRVSILRGLSVFGPFAGLFLGLIFGVRTGKVIQINYPAERLYFTIKNFLFVYLPVLLIGVLGGWLVVRLGFDLQVGLMFALVFGPVFGLALGFFYGGETIVKHYCLHYVVTRNNLLPWKLISFLDHCVDLIFLRRVGGGYIFVHRLLMEHFADMYAADEK